ncbi:hypothetical protein P4B35_17610 [Pontiellaceae bacterium B12227]|nr:hypothetical protein [Pontiellaceae bacterium B12227]
MGAGLGELKRDAEKKAAESTPKPEKPPHQSNAANSSFGSGTFPSESAASSGSGFAGDFWGWLVAGPFRYRSDDPNASMNAQEEGWAEDGGIYRPKHQQGESIMPYVRADLNWQYIDGDNSAIDGRVEVGYKAIAFQARSTRYDDSLADLTQQINQYYGMLRYGFRWPAAFPGTIELALGVGVAKQDGDLSDDSSVAVTLPLKYHPTDWLGFEFRSAWYEADYSGYVFNIGDYDLSACLGYRYIQLRAGYRWLWFSRSDNGRYNDGPYAGLSLSF